MQNTAENTGTSISLYCAEVAVGYPLLKLQCHNKAELILAEEGMAVVCKYINVSANKGQCANRFALCRICFNFQM